MPKKTKIKLQSLKVKSFVTSTDAEDAKGGRPPVVFTPDEPTASTCTCVSCLDYYCQTFDCTKTCDTCEYCPTMSCPFCETEPGNTEIICL